VFYSPFFIASIHEIDKHISDYQEAFTSLPRSSHLRSAQLVELGHLRLKRFFSSDDERDLDASILHHTHAIFLPFHHPTEHRQAIAVTGILIRLSRLLILRSRKSKQPSDIRYSAKCFRYVRDLSLQVEAFDITPLTRKNATSWLVCALALQVELEHGNAMHAIEEMTVLCRELLSSDASERELNAAVENFARTLIGHAKDTYDLPWQQVIECLCEANIRLPDSHSVSMALSMTFGLRFDITKSNDDYLCAMGHIDKLIAFYSRVGGHDQHLRVYLYLAATLATRRSDFYSNPEHLEEAIRRTRAHLDVVSVEDPGRDKIIRTLTGLVRNRAREFGDTGIPKRYHNNPVVDDFDLSSFWCLAAFLAEWNSDEPRSMEAEALGRHVDAVKSAGRIADTAEIHKAVQYCRQLHPSLRRSPNQFTDITLFELGNLLRHAFNIMNEPAYLNESIDILRSMLEARHTQWMYISVIEQLISALSTRLELFKDINDLNQMVQLFPIISSCPYAKAPDRLKLISCLAVLSRAFQHPFTSAIYSSAISLMNDTLLFAPTLEIQHFRLVQWDLVYEKLPSDYASYQVQRGQLKEAIETLEQGRGLVWSQMRGFRTPIDRLWVINSHLAEEFASVNRELEVLTTSASPSVLMNSVEVGDEEEMGSFDHVLAKHRNLLDERNSLIAQIRALPGFENFLMAPSFAALHSAAAYGPVIIINHSAERSDIVILLYNSPPSLIPTTDNFYDRANGLREQLLGAQKKGLDTMEYEDTLVSVLKALYDLVGRPVIQRLRELNVPEQSRIWWCPTSVFCSLPLHAMGPIRSDGPHKLYFSDLYIPSYTPTLSALIDSRKPNAHSSEKPSILLVAQTDEFMPRAWDEISLIRGLKTTVITLASKRATPSGVMKRLQDHRFAHFSCHGTLDTGKPYDASFKLYQGKRLTLLEIIRSRLPSAEFAFLSACHTAELTANSVTGEGLHLTAAVQFAGFRSVVGTMWAMADIDGHDLAKHFYASVFSERWQGVPYYERTAEALRDAVRELRRKKNMSTERWVNFVHYGA